MAGRPPNLLFVFSDEMRGADLGHAGNPDAQTPHADRFAATGVSFVNAIANCPVCTPSRGSMLTGRHPLAHHALSNDVPIRTDLPTLGTLLRDAGYATGYIGKWHLDGLPRFRFTPPGPRRLGFDDFWAVWNCHHDYFKGTYYRDTPEVQRITGYEPFAQTDMAIEFMEQQQTRPFALALSWGPPHGPLELVPDEFRRRVDPAQLTLPPNIDPDTMPRWALSIAVPPWAPEPGVTTRFDGNPEQRIRESLACYYAGITALDVCFGRLLDSLERLGLADNTVVVYTSDHGSMHWSHNRIRKQQPWEETIRVPLLIRAPEQLPCGQSSEVLASTVDLLPTVLELLGEPIPASLDGISVRDAVAGTGPAPESVLIGVPVPVDGVTEEGVGRAWRGVRTARHTYARWEDGETWVLYDNSQDPYQLNNLADTEPAAALQKQLDDVLNRQLAQNDDPFLPWEDCLRACGLTAEWNLRERMSYPDGGRQVE